MEEFTLGLQKHKGLEEILQAEITYEDDDMIDVLISAINKYDYTIQYSDNCSENIYTIKDNVLMPRIEDSLVKIYVSNADKHINTVKTQVVNQLVYDKMYYMTQYLDSCKDNLLTIFSPIVERTKNYKEVNIFISNSLLSKLELLNKELDEKAVGYKMQSLSIDLFKELINQLKSDSMKKVNILSRYEDGRVYRYINYGEFGSFEPRVISNYLNNGDPRMTFVSVDKSNHNIEFGGVLDNGKNFLSHSTKYDELYKSDIAHHILQEKVKFIGSKKPIIVLNFNDFLDDHHICSYIASLIKNQLYDFNIVDLKTILTINNYVHHDTENAFRELMGIEKGIDLSDVTKAQMMKYVYYKLVQ